jgi:PLP dependent protein
MADVPPLQLDRDDNAESSIIASNLAEVRERIDSAARRSGRGPTSVRLVAVTKRAPISWTMSLVRAGQCDLGENYPQELWSKAQALPSNIRWHLIGHLQSNKLKRTWPLVRMIHAVDSLSLLRRIDEVSTEVTDPPALCLQLNLSGEEAKHGWSEATFWPEVASIAELKNARIVGFMTMAGYNTTPEQARPTFERLRKVRDRFETELGRTFPELSMGMSGDYEAAIEEGATLVRIGSALFQGLKTP